MNKSFFKALNSLDKDILANIDLIDVDVELDTDLAIKYKIRTIPALVITSTNHDEYHSMVGFYLVREIKHFITSNYMLLRRPS
jgi:hypothetical protein